MSYTYQVKEQLYEYEIKKSSEKLAEFYAYYMMTGGTLKTGNIYVARRLTMLCSRRNARMTKVSYRSGDKPQYCVSIRFSGTASFETENEAKAFIRGCFMTGGFINDLDKPAHFEIVFKEQIVYEMCLAAFEQIGLFVKANIRNGNFVIYAKDSDTVCEILGSIGAVKAMLEIEDKRIYKQCASEGNRVTNCDDANISRAIEAGLKQKTAFEKLRDSSKFDELPQELKETLLLRIEYPEVSVVEFAGLFTPVLSKAGAYHRLTKLVKISESLDL